MVIASTQIGWLIQLFRKIFLGVVGISTFYLLITSFYLLVFQERSTIQFTMLEHPWFLAATILTTALILIFGWLMNVRAAKKGFAPPNSNVFTRFTVSFLIWLFATAVIFGISSLLSVDQELSVYVIFALNLVSLLLISWSLAFLPNKIDEKESPHDETSSIKQTEAHISSNASRPNPNGRAVSGTKRK